MIAFPAGVRVWIAGGVTDMRRGMNTLALQVQQGLGRDSHAGEIFCFRGRRGDLVKLLWHDGVGMSLYTKRLSLKTAARMEATLVGAGYGPSFAALKADPGRVALESVLKVAGRLSFIRGLALPREALIGIGPPVIERLRRRVAQENGWEMRRHPRERRLGLFALYLLRREAALVAGLVLPVYGFLRQRFG